MQLTIANGQVIWILVLLFSLPLVNTRSVFASISKDPAKDHSSQCDCFITSGPEPGFYKYHRFFDFRDIADTTNNVSSPPNTQSKDKVGAPNSRDKFLNTAPFSDFWQIQHWTKPVTDAAPLPLVNSGQNLYISRESEMMGNSTYLTLRTHRLPGFVSGAEIQSLQQNIYHGSFRVRMRIIPNSSNFFGDVVSRGACAGFFTYFSRTSESDIEILTNDAPFKIHYTNQPDLNSQTQDMIPGASSKVDMPAFAYWTDWHDYRLDWSATHSRWFLDGELMLEKTYSVPQTPMTLILNLWSDSGSWSGQMAVGDTVELGVQWVDMVFNTSGPVFGPNGQPDFEQGEEQEADIGAFFYGDEFFAREQTCNQLCTVDDVTKAGYPQKSTMTVARLAALKASENIGLRMISDGWVSLPGLSLLLMVTTISTAWLLQ